MLLCNVQCTTKSVHTAQIQNKSKLELNAMSSSAILSRFGTSQDISEIYSFRLDRAQHNFCFFQQFRRSEPFPRRQQPRRRPLSRSSRRLLLPLSIVPPPWAG